MPKWIEPGSDDARVTFMKRAVTTAELIHEVMDELRFNLRKKDEPSQRRIMRYFV